MAIDIHLQTFEGPLDLLLHLIETRKLNIWDIPIAEVTEQYLQYLRQMQELSLEVASEFLVMAARLLEIKSRMLLPRPPRVEEDSEEGDEDPRLALAARLVEYQSFKRLAAVLADLERKRERVWTRPPMTVHRDVPMPAGPRESPEVLLEAFRHVLWRAFSEMRQARVDREELRVEEKVEEIAMRVRRAGRLTFRELLGKRTDRGNVVVSLLALLELMKEKRVRCIQERLFGDIWIYWVDRGDGPWTRPI